MKPKAPEKIMMKNAYILKNDWLRYAKGISEKAFEETDSKCVIS
jgi:hypothetical protein